MELIQLPERPPDWDRSIQRYETKTLFHESAWLDHLLRITPRSSIEYFKITDNGQSLGYFCALNIRKYLITIYGSPLGGTGTNYMGPILDGNTVSQGEFARSLVKLCKSKRIMHVELGSEWFDPEVMEAHGFIVHRNVTHLCPLPPDEQTAWRFLKSTCRNRIRKAEKNGLTVELTDDLAIVDHFYAQFVEVYGKQGMIPPYSKDRPRRLLDSLLAADRIFPLWVKHKGKVIATGFFPHDERCVYFWGATSWLKDQYLCPNEVLHWTVMKLAIARGIALYNMCGGISQFKDKFGGSDVPYNTYSRSFLPGLGTARQIYRYIHFRMLKFPRFLRASSAPRKTRIG